MTSLKSCNNWNFDESRNLEEKSKYRKISFARFPSKIFRLSFMNLFQILCSSSRVLRKNKNEKKIAAYLLQHLIKLIFNM